MYPLPAAMLLAAALGLLSSVLAATIDLRGKEGDIDVNAATHHAEVIILGGGISGIALARSLITDHNITDIVLIEARNELGGRAYTETLANSITGESVHVEKGCNWIQGPGKEPILALAEKWGLKTARQNYSSTAWFDGLGIEADGKRGTFVDGEEQEAFMASYDAFLDKAPEYSSES